LSGTAERLDRNLRLYAWFLPLSRVYFWTPVFFLYLSERFSMSEVLQLEALYYLVVVLVEVPSGYFSDRVGRRATLLISGAVSALAYALFLVGGTSFVIFACAEVALAVGYAFLSGTDTSLHFDTLSGVGREEEFAAREARLARNGFWAASAAALAAGAAGMLDLRIPYALALLNALALTLLALGFFEPHRHVSELAGSFGRQLAKCAGYLRKPFLLWLFAYFLLKITMEHIPYEFAQPYLAIVLGERLGELRFTPLASGALVAAIAFVAAFASDRSLALRSSLGLGGALLAVGGLQLGLIAVMAAVLSPWVVPLICLRSVQAAVANPLLNAAIAPAVSRDVRATYLSLHSLGGRLGYSAVLFGLAAVAGHDSATDPAMLRRLLEASALLCLVGLLALALTRHTLARGQLASG
jgi:MFS family permease